MYRVDFSTPRKALCLAQSSFQGLTGAKKQKGKSQRKKIKAPLDPDDGSRRTLPGTEQLSLDQSSMVDWVSFVKDTNMFCKLSLVLFVSLVHINSSVHVLTM
eukprot:m.200747 g.200747  ORF g.200747 m.200747 type:complete len:102 (+) comp14966_c0_seq1:440-745(+)